MDNIAFCTHLDGAQNNGPRRGFARTVSEHERKTFALAFEFYETLSAVSFSDCVEMVLHFHLVSQEVGAQELGSRIGHGGNDRGISLLSVRVTHGQGKLIASGCEEVLGMSGVCGRNACGIC